MSSIFFTTKNGLSLLHATGCLHLRKLKRKAEDLIKMEKPMDMLRTTYERKRPAVLQPI